MNEEYLYLVWVGFTLCLFIGTIALLLKNKVGPAIVTGGITYLAFVYAEAFETTSLFL